MDDRYVVYLSPRSRRRSSLYGYLEMDGEDLAHCRPRSSASAKNDFGRARLGPWEKRSGVRDVNSGAQSGMVREDWAANNRTQTLKAGERQPD